MNWGQYGRVHATGGEPWLPTDPTEPPLNPLMSLARGKEKWDCKYRPLSKI